MNVNGCLLGWMILAGLVYTDALAQHSETPNRKTYEELAKPLRLAPKQRFKFSRARLGDIMRMLAAEAGISFVSHLDDTDDTGLVTFTLEGSPFSALEAIARNHGIELIVKNDVWSTIQSPSGNVRTVTYEHPYHNVTSPAVQKQWPEYVARLFRPHDQPHDTYFPAPFHPIVELDFSLVQIDIGHDEILMGPQQDGPVTRIIRSNEEKSRLEALLAHPATLTISQRKVSLQPYRKILIHCLSSEVVDGVKRIAPDPDPGHGPSTGINLPMPPVLTPLSFILPRGTQVALECNASDKVEAILHIDTTQTGLRKGTEKNPTIDMLFAATQHRTTIKAPIGKTVVVGSFERHASGQDIALQKNSTKRVLLMVRPTKVVTLDRPDPLGMFEELNR